MAAVLRGEREDLPLEITKKLQCRSDEKKKVKDMWWNDDERRSWEEIGLFKVFAKRERVNTWERTDQLGTSAFTVLLIVSPPLILN